MPEIPLDRLVSLAAAGDLKAYEEIVCRFQDMAVGYAHTLLDDFHLAEDTAQDAFLQAYQSLGQLANPAAFPGWFRRIVFSYANRLMRGKKLDTVPIDKTPDTPDRRPDPEAAMVLKERQSQILDAMGQLPQPQRQVLTLFYMGGHSHLEIATFMDLPPTTVNNRLRAARRNLKERMLEMAEKELAQNAPSRDDSFATAVSFCTAAQAGDLDQVQRILQARPDLVEQTHPQHRRKALHFAAEEGYAPVVKLLLQAGADPLEDFNEVAYSPAALVLARRAGHYHVVDAIEAHYQHRLETDDTLPTARDDRGNTLLHLAIYHRCRTLASSLLAKGADPNVRNRWGQRPIDLAIYNNSNLLLPWEKRPDGLMAALLLEAGVQMDLWLACALGETHLVRRFLDEDPSAANKCNGARRQPGGISYPLTIAAWRGDTEAARLLLDHGADPDCANCNEIYEDDYENRGAPLMMAIHNGHLKIAHLLLDRGAQANVSIYAGPTALKLAQKSGDEELVKRLVMGGARLLPGELAAAGNYLAIGEILDRCGPGEAGEILLGGVRGTDKTVVGMSLNAKPELRKGLTYRILSNVIRYDRDPQDSPEQEEVFRMILDNGVDVNDIATADEEGLTLLHGLSHKWWMKGLDEDGPARYAALLLDHGAQLEAKDANEGLTPLQWAARYGRLKLVELFLERGAKGKAKAKGEAKERGFEGVARLLG